ncbi:MAG: MotA/TolQ/ExbB proton channel family protein [Verrucomicrobiales bacterium]|nr:MotA/TolQ/ExbB proton channel family protein [Verrucomicrobiales bacterium]
MFVFTAPELFAQDDGGTGGDSTEEVAEAPPTLWTKIKQGGWAMWPLAVLSICMITLAVYNFMQLTRGKFIPPALQQNVLANMMDVRVRSAIEASAADPSYLGRMLASSLPFVDATDPETLGREKVEDAIADFSVKENPSYMSWVGYFSVIAQASPMIGLLGTVSGMIKAFDLLGATGGANPAKMAAAIGEALMTTATGLVVALPCLFFFYFFKNRFAVLVNSAHETAAQAMEAAIATVNADQQLAKVPEGISEG